MFKTQAAHDLTDTISQPREYIDQSLGGIFKFAWGKMLDAHRMRLLHCFDLGRDPRMACPRLTVSTNGTANRDHGQRCETNAVRAQAHEFDHIGCSADATVGPDLHLGSQAGFTQRTMRLHNTDLSGQSHIAERVHARSAGTTIETGQVD